MQKFTYTNELGSSIELQDYEATGDIYRLLSGTVDPFVSSATTEKGFKQDGTSYKYSRGEPRNITLKGLFMGSGFSDMYEQANELKTIFNPRLDEGTLLYENDYVSKEITVKVEAEPIIPTFKNIQNNTFGVLMTAYDPFFRDIDYTTISLVGISDGFEFTSPSFDFPTSTDFTMGDLSGSSGVVANLGHVPAPLLIRWTGAATDPKVTLDDTGEFILLDRVLTSDERVIITTGYGDKEVYIETISTGVITKDFSVVDPTSTFFSIPIGNSTVSFSATAGGSDSVVTVSYKQLWTGV